MIYTTHALSECNHAKMILHTVVGIEPPLYKLEK